MLAHGSEASDPSQHASKYVHRLGSLHKKADFVGEIINVFVYPFGKQAELRKQQRRS
jgi:hypothetical protein